jgi:cardiolipin synthase
VNLANMVSISRLVILPFFMLAYIYGRPGVALGLVILAGLSDLLDGWLARRLDQKTTLGEYLDPATDKLLAATGFIVMTLPLDYPNRVPLYLTTLVFTRDFLIALVAIVLFLGGYRKKFPPTWLGRTHSTVAVLTLGLYLLHNTLGTTTFLIPLATWATLITTLSSGIHYAYLAYGMSISPDEDPDERRDLGTPEE